MEYTKCSAEYLIKAYKPVQLQHKRHQRQHVVVRWNDKGPSYTFLPGLRPVRDQWQHSPRATLPLNRREILFYTLALLRLNLSAQSPERLCKNSMFFSSASRNPFELEFFTALLGTTSGLVDSGFVPLLCCCAAV